MERARLGEEDAYGENGVGSFDALVWPPRSYFCNFCGREFGSAQALGGHMNVHRRDRARLKQSLGLENHNLHHHRRKRFQHPSPRKIVRSEYPYCLLLKPDSTTRVFLSAVSGSGITSPDLTGKNSQKPPVLSCDYDKENTVRGKRVFPFLLSKSTSRKNDDHQEEVKRLSVGAKQDLDLELRLGFSLF